MVTHYDIMNHWKHKYITQDGNILDKRESNAIAIVYDLGEPSCWGCDAPVDHKAKTYEPSSEQDIKLIWNSPNTTKHLNKCHILAKTLGGDYSADNLFLMCPECHRLSPDTTNRKNFFRWVYERRKRCFFGIDVNLYFDELIGSISRRFPNCNSKELLYKLNKYFDRDECIKYFNQHATMHEFGVSRTTIVDTYIDYLLSMFMKDCLDRRN